VALRKLFQDTDLNPAASKDSSETDHDFSTCRTGSAVKEDAAGEALSKRTAKSCKKVFFFHELGRGYNSYMNGRIWVINVWEATSSCMVETLRKYMISLRTLNLS